MNHGAVPPSSSRRPAGSGQASGGPADPGLSSAALRGAVDLSALANRASARQSAGQAAGQQGGPESGAGGGRKPRFVVDVNDASFEQLMQLSGQVICLVGLYADQVPGSQEAIDALVPLVAKHRGRIALGRVRGEEAPSVFQAFQLQAVPAAVALIKGQPVPIFQGNPPQDWDSVFSQLIQLGDEHGVTESIPDSGDGGEEEGQDAPEPALSEEEQAALDAIGREDYAEAERLYDSILANSPADEAAKQGRLNAQLLGRLHGADVAAARERAAADQDDLEAQLLVADADVTNGHVEDALTRLIRFVASHAGEEREAARVRIVDLFTVIGADHPAVGEARRKLAAALF